MAKRTPPPADDQDTAKPFFKCFPSNLLAGCIKLSAEEKGVYYTLLFLLYDAWEPIDDGTVKQRQDLARFCGTTTRGFTTIRDRLLGLPNKLVRDSDGHLTNPRFERERLRMGKFKSDLSPEKSARKSNINGEINEAGSNDIKGIPDLSRARESRVHIPDSTVPGSNKALSDDAEQVLESEIQQICRAIGVDLRTSTKRAGWPHAWVTMRAQHNLTVGDMVAAIETYSTQFKGEQVRSLHMFKDRAIEKRVARELSDRLTTRAHAHTQEINASLSDKDWHTRLVIFLRVGTWSTKYGPSPLEPDCLAPHGLLDLAETKWIAQGNHPELMQAGQNRQAWQQGMSDPIRMPIAFAKRST